MAEPPAASSSAADSVEAKTGDVVAALNSAQIDTKDVSKNAQKKAAKQEKLAAQKANKSATNTTPEAAKASAKKAVNKPVAKKAQDPLISINASKDEDFPGWYQQVLTKGEMLDYYDVSGCYILKVLSTLLNIGAFTYLVQPASYFIWESIQEWFNKKIKAMGVKNCSFPLFVSQDVLEREKDHIEGFAAEVAWVTHASVQRTLPEPEIRLQADSKQWQYSLGKENRHSSYIGNCNVPLLCQMDKKSP